MTHPRHGSRPSLRAIFRRFPWVLEVRLLWLPRRWTARDTLRTLTLAIWAPDASAGEWLELIDTIEEAPIIYEFDIRPCRAH